MNFQRGGDIKETLEIGRDGLLKIIGGRIISSKAEPRTVSSMSEDNVIILVEKGTYEILKNRFSGNYSKGPETELVKTLLELLEEFNKWDRDRIWINTDGNVGIGIATPSIKLNIK